MIQFVDTTKPGGEVFSMPSELILFAMIGLLPISDRHKLFAALRAAVLSEAQSLITA